MTENAEHVHIRHVTQSECSADLNEAVGQFNVIDRDGTTPLVLVPRTRWCCNPVLKIPSGVAAIVQRFGADVGEFTPGLHCAGPWYRVMYLVTKQSCTYYYQIANCPTKDNVMVKVEATLVFRILQPHTFVYTLGATKFDDALKAVAEEAIRANVRMIKHTNIFSLRGSGADYLLQTLNKMFDKFGVLFSNATIVNVELPQDLASALQNATTYDAKMRQQIRSQEFALKVLNDENDQALKALHLENERLSAAELARKERVLIELQTKKSEAERKKQLAVIKAEQDQNILKTQAQTVLETESQGALADMEFKIKRQAGQSKAMQIEVDQLAQAERLQAEAALIEAQNRAKAILLEADAEAKVFEQMQQKRQYDLQMSAVRAMQQVARQGKIVISGASGKTFVDSLTASLQTIGEPSGRKKA
mmetsp:Transcript_28143/g.39730  ORF Transcript_28143/g.39730 Transcript_28143/m.39730 type:complete len:420 (-) Transcript_28143:73-1332(-)|eukprot:CAMPEP_0168561574 /NCGR_PEP_ID=MMETSP0413-20121227/11666_1 /TAXON_ID=136452 /ORGANISM="Filamoeba nolandi, Strain NC-AS-23-1" /LENGTH=419 /DNA_ID=CAMNT_0008592951 /DNA_START=32 /DNA_END=1291 /DNA_ORIENTATION=-